MKFTEELVEEHKLILRMILVLESAVDKSESTGIVDTEIFEQVADFIRNFADKYHHAKEEDILFKKMVAHGMPEKDSPIEAMLTQHEQGRSFVRGMLEATEELKSGDETSSKEIITNAKGYIELLREHIEKENDVLYPLAERILPDKIQYELQNEFQLANEKKGGVNTFQKFRKLVEILEKQ